MRSMEGILQSGRKDALFLQDETVHRSVYEIFQQWDGNIENDSVKHIYVS